MYHLISALNSRNFDLSSIFGDDMAIIFYRCVIRIYLRLFRVGQCDGVAYISYVNVLYPFANVLRSCVAVREHTRLRILHSFAQRS